MTTWTFAGTALTSFGKITILNDYLDMPERRGSNQLIPYRHGTSFVQKYYDERHISMGFILSAASSTALEQTLDTMHALFATRTEGTLSQTRDDSTVRNALACVDTGLQIDRKRDTLVVGVIDFTLTSPYFRSGTLIADNTVTMSAGTVAGTVVNTGTIEERDPTITLVGPLNNTVLTNSTNGYSLTYAGTIGAAATVTIQTATTGEYTATSGTSNVIGNVTHSGGAALMCLNVGTNIMSYVNSGGTTGTVKISFYAPYL